MDGQPGKVTNYDNMKSIPTNHAPLVKFAEYFGSWLSSLQLSAASQRSHKHVIRMLLAELRSTRTADATDM